jgi:hypothetical protein
MRRDRGPGARGRRAGRAPCMCRAPGRQQGHGGQCRPGGYESGGARTVH